MRIHDVCPFNQATAWDHENARVCAIDPRLEVEVISQPRGSYKAKQELPRGSRRGKMSPQTAGCGVPSQL